MSPTEKETNESTAFNVINKNIERQKQLMNSLFGEIKQMRDLNVSTKHRSKKSKYQRKIKKAYAKCREGGGEKSTCAAISHNIQKKYK